MRLADLADPTATEPHARRGEMGARHLVALVAALVVALLLASSAPIASSAARDFGAGPDAWSGDLTPITSAEWTRARAAHLLERAGFGGTPEEVERLAAMTPAEAVAFLVDYDSLPDGDPTPFDESPIYPNGYKFRSIQELAREAMTTGKALGIDARREGKLPLQPGIDEFYTLLWSDFGEIARAGQWWAERMLTTPRPFEERMTLFWHDHFATSQEKVHRHRKMIRHVDTLRQHALGDFEDLLVAVSQDPAMLIWLDNKDNVKGHPNENYAREIMELFTMGEGNGYTEADIREVARAFTGWTITEDHTTDPGDGVFVDRAELHDDGEKTILGQTGDFDGYEAIAIIVRHPATARFITEKIYRYYVREELDRALHDRLAAALTEGGFEIAPLMKTIFLSRDFYSEPTVGSMIKSPVHLVVSTYRKLGLDEIPGLPDFGETTGSLGQSLFLPPNVAGWPGHYSWINPATLLSRGNFVEALLFPPDPMLIEPPDKDIHPGYRKIPVMFPDYDIVGHVWDQRTMRMEPVPLVLYDKYLAGLPPHEVFAMIEDGRAATMEMGESTMMNGAAMGTSKMAQVAHGEQYNLAVGVYNGHVEANRRVKPIPRVPAAIDLVAVAERYEIDTVAELVDHFIERFLRVEIHADRRAAIEQFARQQLGADQIARPVDDATRASLEEGLRRVLHLILSTPEYQLA
ncbi:MAG: DUF1800 domain-containing protein [Acidobacteria bacterium]|nr:MAG: DUF1800 domain-containing protein [Acidobacteriota bacterium]REK05867.1 MAG: DUF1800 domain-containing protein [Acidobacteriota bacterium]